MPPPTQPTSRSQPSGQRSPSRPARLAEIVAQTAATEMMSPEVAATRSMPGRCATLSGTMRARLRSMYCARKSRPSTAAKCGMRNISASGSRSGFSIAAPGVAGRASVKSMIKPSSESAHIPAVTKKAARMPQCDAT